MELELELIEFQAGQVALPGSDESCGYILSKTSCQDEVYERSAVKTTGWRLMAVLVQGDVDAVRSTAISFGRTAASGIGASCGLPVKDWTDVGNFEAIQSNS